MFLAHKASHARKTISAKQETGRVYLRHQHAQQDYNSHLHVLDLLVMLLNVHFQQLLSIGKHTILLNLKILNICACTVKVYILLKIKQINKPTHTNATLVQLSPGSRN